MGRAAVGMGEAGGQEALARRELGQVRPHLEGERVRGEAAGIAAPVDPTLAGGIARAAEPTLVAAQHFPAQRGGIDRLGRGRLRAQVREGPAREATESEDGRDGDAVQTAHVTSLQARLVFLFDPPRVANPSLRQLSASVACGGLSPVLVVWKGGGELPALWMAGHLYWRV